MCLPVLQATVCGCSLFHLLLSNDLQAMEAVSHAPGKGSDMCPACRCSFRACPWALPNNGSVRHRTGGPQLHEASSDSVHSAVRQQ